MGYRHTKEEILDEAVAVAVDDGLSKLTFGRLAKRMGINDRTVVYYFPTKDDLISEVLLSVGARLQQVLGPAFSDTSSDHVELAAKAWPILARPESDAVFALFFEASGLAAAGHEPYQSLVPQLVEAWISWVGEFVSPGTNRRAVATAVVAQIDGLLLVRQLAGPEAAQQAARELGLL